MTNQMATTIESDYQAAPVQVAEWAVQATDRPAMRTIDTLRGEDRKRFANLAIKCLN
jgi:hypothetical protein